MEQRDNMLFFPVEGVVIIFREDTVVLFINITQYSGTYMLIKALSGKAATCVEKINQKRGWDHLVKCNHPRYVDYGDPTLFELIETALKRH